MYLLLADTQYPMYPEVRTVILHIVLRPVQPLVMFIGDMTGSKDMNFEDFVVGETAFFIFTCHLPSIYVLNP